MSDNIKVAIKVRPLIAREREDNLTYQWTIKENSLIPNTGSASDIFYFDHVFDTQASNNDVYNAVVAPITTAAVNGFNGTIFAYGQTSSGKTYTMLGSKQESGVVELVVNDIFKIIASHSNREFLLRASFIEIYNEKIHDLLDNSKNKQTINVYEDVNGIVKLNVKEEISDTPENLLEIMRRGEKNRRIGETNMNERSSRSHTIFRIIIESRMSNDPEGAIQVSHLNLVDLAGSERVSQTGAKGVRLREGTHINLSLLTLSRVINQLSDTTDPSRFISFRDSKLTRILQSSLGGNAKTVIICAITPASLEESLSTLSFASRAKSIKNKPKVNEIVSNDTLLKRYANQISMLQVQLEREKNANMNLQSNQEEASLVNRRLQERICLLQKFMLKPKITPVKPIIPARVESIDKTLRRQTWCAPAKNLFSVPQFIFNEDSCLDELKTVHNFNELTINNSAAFIPGEHFEFDVFNFNNSVLLKEHTQKETNIDNESIPMEQFELELIECVKNKINESSSTTAVHHQNSLIETERRSDSDKFNLEKLNTQLSYYRTEYETIKDFVKDENIILNERIIDLEKTNEIIQEENSKIQDLLKYKDVELNSLKFKLNELNNNKHLRNGPLLKDESIDGATTRLLQKKDEIFELKNDIDRQISIYNAHDVDKNTDYLRRLHNEFIEILKILDMNSKALVSMQRVNLRYKTIIQNLKAPRIKLDTIIENEDDAEEDSDLIQDIVTDTLRLQTVIRDMNNQIDYLQTYNKKMETEYQTLRDDFSDKIKKQIIDLNQLTIDNKKLQVIVDNLKLERCDFERKYNQLTEFKKQIEQEKVFWEQLQRKNNILKQQVDSLQESKNDNDLKLKNLEDSYLMKIQESTNELQNKLDNLETCKRNLENEIEVLKHNNTSLDLNYKHIHDSHNELQQLHSDFYNDLQKLKCRFEKVISKQTSSVENTNEHKENELIGQYRWLIDAVEKYQQSQDIIQFEFETKVNNFNSQITELKIKIDKLQNSKQVDISGRDEKKNETDSWEKDSIISLKQELTLKEDKISELETEIGEIKKLNLEQNHDIREHQDKIKDLIKELEETKLRHTNYNEEVINCKKEFDDSINSMKQELKVRKDKISELETEIGEIKKLNLEQNHEIREHQDKIKDLIKELEETTLRHSNYNEEIINSKKELDDSINSMKQELKMKDDKISDLETEIEDIKKLNLEQNHDIREHQDKIKDLIKELEETKLRHTNYNEEVINCKKEFDDSINSMKQELKMRKDKISELETEIGEIKKLNLEQNHEIREHQDKIKDLIKELEETTLRHSNYNEEIINSKKELDDSINSMKQELKMKDDKISDLETEIEDIKKLNLEQNHDIREHQDKIKDLIKELEETKLRHTNYNEEVINCKKEFDDSINSMKQELKVRKDKISELETEIGEIKKLNLEQNHEIREHQDKIKDLIKELEETTLRHTNYNEEIINSKKELDDSINSMKQELKMKKDKISDLETEIEDIKKLNLEQNHDILEHQDKIKDLIKELDETKLRQKNNNEVITLNKELDDSINSMKQELKLKTDKIYELEKEMETISILNSDLSMEIQNYKDKDLMRRQLAEAGPNHKEFAKHIYTEGITSKEEFEQSINSYKQEFKLKEDKISELETEIEDIKKLNLDQNHDILELQEKIKHSINSFKQEIKLKEDKISELETEIEDIKKLNLDQNHDILELQEKIKHSINSFKQETKLKEDKISELETEIEDIKILNLEHNHDIQEHQEKIKDLIKQLKEAEINQKELLNSVNFFKQELNRKEVIISELETQMEDIKKLNLEQNHEIVKYQDEIQVLTMNLEGFTSKNQTEFNREKQSLESSIKMLKQELDQKQLIILELQATSSKYNDYEKSNTKQEEQILNYENNESKSRYIENKQKEINLLKQEIKSKEFTIQDLEKKLYENIEENKKLIASLNDRIQSLTEKEDNSELIIQNLKSRLSSLENTNVLNFEQHTQKINQIQQKATYEENYSQLRMKKIDDAIPHSKDLSKTITEQNQLIIEHEKQITLLTNQTEALQLKNSQISESELENKLKNCEEKYNTKIHKLNKEIEKLVQANKMKAQCFKQARCENVKFQAQLTVLNEELHEKEMSMKQLESTISKLETENLLLEKSINNLKQSLKSKEDIIQSLETNVKSMKEEIKDNLIKSSSNSLETCINSLKQELQSKDIIIKNLETKILNFEDLESREKVNQSNFSNLTDTERLLSQKVESKDVIIQNLQTNIVRLEQELKETTLKCVSLKHSTDKSVGISIELLKQELESKDIIIKNLETKISNLKDSERSSREKFHDIHLKYTHLIDTEIKSKDDVIQDLERRLLEVEKSNQQTITELKYQSISENFTSHESMSSLTQNIQLKENTIQDLEKQLSKMENMRKHMHELKRKLLNTEKEKENLIRRLEIIRNRNDELSETYSCQLFRETEYLEDMINKLKQELELKKDTIQNLEQINSQQNSIALKYEDQIKSLMNQIKDTAENSSKIDNQLELIEKLKSKDTIIQNLNKKVLEFASNNQKLNQDLKIKEKIIFDLNNKLLPLKNHNGNIGNELKENYEIDKHNNELQKLTKEIEKLTQANKMNIKCFKQARCENVKIQAKLTVLEDKYKEKEISVAQLQSRIQDLTVKNNELLKQIEQIMKDKDTGSKLLENKVASDCKNCLQIITNNNLNKQLELEIVSLKSENEVNIQKIHDLEDEIIELKLSVNHPHRSNTPSPTTVRKNRLSSSKRNELFDESRRIRMEQELFEVQQQQNLMIALSNQVPEKHDKEVQADIIGSGAYHVSGIAIDYFQEKQLYEMTKKKNFYKELAIVRKKKLVELQNESPEKPINMFDDLINS